MAEAIRTAPAGEGNGAPIRLLMLRLKGAVAARLSPAAADLLLAIEEQHLSIDLVAARTVSLSAAALPDTRRSAQLHGRAARMATALHSAALAVETEWAESQLDAGALPNEPCHDLETAVALLELGGRPHVLAGEAMAPAEGGWLCGGGCVGHRHRTPSAPRPRHARLRRRPRRGDGRQTRPGLVAMELGRHRDESWRILVAVCGGVGLRSDKHRLIYRSLYPSSHTAARVVVTGWRIA